MASTSSRPSKPLIYALYTLLFFSILPLSFWSTLFRTPAKKSRPLEMGSYQRYLSDLKEGRIESIVYPGSESQGREGELELEVNTKHQQSYHFDYPAHLSDRFIEEVKDIPIHQKPKNFLLNLFQTLSSMLDMLFKVTFLCLFFMALFLYFFPQGFRRILSWSSDEPTGVRPTIGFDAVAGNHEAKEEVKQLVMALKSPEPFKKLGARLPKGVLFSGLPGTGKTLLARAIAGEAGVPFLACSGSEFEEKYVGVGATRLRRLFQVAKSQAPTLIFIDEIDSIGGNRQTRFGSQYHTQTLNQLLVEMDGFSSDDRVLVIAATNQPETLDHALVRAGRFDRHIHLQAPSVQEREEILKLHTQKIRLEKSFDHALWAKMTSGFVGAELANLANEAALRAVALGLEEVNEAAFEYAFDRICMGAHHAALQPTQEELTRTAYHESGHALVALALPESDPVRKLTILPRGQSLGMMQALPERDRLHIDGHHLKNRLIVCCGGRAAEALIYGEARVSIGASAGPSSDLAKATQLARAMVIQYGFSDALGFACYEEAFSKGSLPVSNQLLHDVESSTKALIDQAYQDAYAILEKNRSLLESIKTKLLEKETLNAEDLLPLVESHPIQHSAISLLK